MKHQLDFSRFLLPLLLIAWIVSFFGYLGWKPGFAYNAQRYFEILLLGCLLCAGATLPIRFLFGRLWSVCCLLLLLVMLLVISRAENQWLAVREGTQYLALFLVVLVVAKARQLTGSIDFDRAAFIGVVLFCFGCSLIVLEGLLLSLSIGTVDQGIVFGAFVNVRTFAAIQLMTLLILPAAWLRMDSVGWRRFIGVTAILWWGLLLLTGTRTALVALPFSLVLLGYIGWRQPLAKNWLKIVALQFVGGILVFIALRVAFAWFLGTSLWGEGGMSFARSSTGGRLDLWADSWRHFLDHPWLGNGPGSFACFTNELVATPHNLIFQLLSEWGIFMTLICLALALMIFVAMVRFLAVGNRVTSIHLSLFSTVVAVVVASMLDGMIIGPLQQMLLVLMIGWTFHAFGSEKFVAVTERVSLCCKSFTVGVLALFLTLVLWGVKEDLALQRDLLISDDGTINLSYGPRFWADGHDRCPGWHERHRSLD